jgi:hypothetical protein
MQIPEKIERNFEQGLVLNNAGQWVTIEEALLDEVKIRHHLEAGEVFENGRWIPLFEPAPAEDRGEDDRAARSESKGADESGEYPVSSGFPPEQTETRAFSLDDAQTQVVRSRGDGAYQDEVSFEQEFDDSTTRIPIEDYDGQGVDTVRVECAQETGNATVDPLANSLDRTLNDQKSVTMRTAVPSLQPPESAAKGGVSTDEVWERAIARNRILLVIIVAVFFLLAVAGFMYIIFF